nr:integrase, catalytic region, zinc finger, CCHC-type, peptidase aspartic, catalytic [Tanacetum cinerariifolium]
MTGNLKLLINFVWKFMETVRFGNDHVAAILGFGDLQWGNILIAKVYFVEGLGHNLFSVGQFCDSDLEVAFRRNACFVRNLEGVDLLKGDRSTNLYTINLHKMASASPICLMARASSTKSWLWHQRLSHLNFDTINDLARNDLVSSLPKFKYHKEHLCPSCEQGKSKRASHPPKLVPNLRQRLHLLHMDLCGPMRIASINGELDLLFEAMYNDYIGGQPSASVENVPTAQELQVRQTSTTSTAIADTAPTLTNSSSLATNIPITSQDVDELNPNAMVNGNTFVNPFAYSSISDAESSSLQNVDPSNMHTFYQPYPYEFQWTKYHPLEQVIREPSRPVMTRNQLRSDGDMCMYALIVSTLEPKNVKEAMTDPAWIESMQEELLQFKRMDNKHDEEQTVIKNKSRLVVRGYRQEEGLDFEESFAPVKPTKKHLKEVKKIFRYLRETVNTGLWYTKDSGFKLTGFLDADYAGCKDTFKSTSTGAQFLGEKLVSWSSKKQDCTALSTVEAEYVSLSACCAQVLWMRTQLTDYGFQFNKILIYRDSKSAIAISCNPGELFSISGKLNVSQKISQDTLIDFYQIVLWMAIHQRPTNCCLSRSYKAVKVRPSLLIQQYEQFTILEEESIDSGFDRFNTIITSLKALDEGFSSKNYVRKFLRALHPKWRAKVTTIKESKDLSSLALDELISNLKVHDVVMEKDSEIYRGKNERVKSIALKAKKESSDDETLTSESVDEEYAMAVRNFKSSLEERVNLFGNKKKKISHSDKEMRRKERDRKCFRCGDPNHLIGDCPKQSPNKDQKAFIRGSWSDIKNDAEDKTNDETCLIA